MTWKIVDSFLMVALLYLNRQLANGASASGCVEWTVYVGRTSSGYVEQSDYSQSASACQNYCVQKSDCLAVEYVSSSSSSSRQCRVHTNGNNLNTHNEVIDVTQYRLSRTCGDSDSSNSRPQLIQACQPIWKEVEGQNAHGVKKSDSFVAQEASTCLNECYRAMNCVAVDVDVKVSPRVCWPHYNADNLRDKNIYNQKGTNHYQLTGSCASDCVPQSITMVGSHASGSTVYYNATSEQECKDNCTNDLSCVAVDIVTNDQPITCWVHFNDEAIRDKNVFADSSKTLFIPVKRCIASLYYAKIGVKIGAVSAGLTTCASSTLMRLMLLLLLVLTSDTGGYLG